MGIKNVKDTRLVTNVRENMENCEYLWRTRDDYSSGVVLLSTCFFESSRFFGCMSVSPCNKITIGASQQSCESAGFGFIIVSI